MQTVLEPVAQSRSIAHGPALREDPSRLTSLGAALRRAAQVSPAKGVRHLRADGSERHQTYPELLAEASTMLGGLRALGLVPGDKVIFQLHLNEDFVPAFWACVLGGFVPVPISIPAGYDEHNNTLAKLQNAWTMLGSPIVLAGHALAPGLQGFARRQGLSGFRVHVVDEFRRSVPATDYHQNEAEDLALLLLTSGSTGMPKGVQLHHKNILSRSAATAQMNAFGAHDISLNWMPLDHVGGVVMFHIRDVVYGCEQIHAPTEVILQNPLTWLDWVSKYRVTNTWAPNFAFSLINDQAEAIAAGRWDLSSLRFILNAGEAIVSRTARRFLSLLAPHGLPGTSMRPAWGMSETSSAVTYSDRFLLSSTADTDPFVEVGAPIPGFSIRIVDAKGELVPEGKTGSLQVKGATVTIGYYNNPKQNAEVFTADGWFKTGDLGVIKDGQLSITGREKDIIIVNGINFHSHEIESVAEEVEGVEVSFVAATAVRLPTENTDRIAIFFSATAEAQSRLAAVVKAIRAAVVKKEGVNPDYVIPVAKSAIPKTAIGKIQRSQLKQQFERGEFAELVRKYSQTQDGGAAELCFQPTWRPQPLGDSNVAKGGYMLVVADGNGLCSTLVQELARSGHRCVTAESGPAYEANSTDRFRINLAEATDFERVFTAAGGVPSCVVHAATFGASEVVEGAQLEAAQNQGAFSLLALAKALNTAASDGDKVRLLVVSSALRQVLPSDRIVGVHGAVIGIVRTIPQELSMVEARHVDVPVGPNAVEAVVAELSKWQGSGECAWREGTRYAPGLQRLETKDHGRELPFRQGGLYVVTGGLGGVGRLFAAYLLQHFDARVLLVGRAEVPGRSGWKLAANATGEGAERARACLSLEAIGGEFDYVTADVTDESKLRAAICGAEQKWGATLDGILHFAGTYHEATLERENRSAMDRLMQSKCVGLYAIGAIARERPGCLVITSSSVISYFGAYATAAYAAANTFVDAYSSALRAAGVNCHNVLWSTWDGIGMSRHSEAGQALKARGYLPLSAEMGVDCLLHGLRHGDGQILAGLDGRNKLVARHLIGGGAGDPAASPADGYVAPRTAVEKQFARVWQDILGVPRVGLKDNFFELGGRSLLAAKMFAQVHKALGKNLPIPALFKAPSLEQLVGIYNEHPKVASMVIRTLQSGGEGAPVFVIPEAGADLAALAEVAAAFGPASPCYAVQAKSLLGATADGPATVVGDLARRVVDEILCLAPEGPIVIAGRSFGVAAACEVARMLEAKGRPVILVVVSAPPAAFFEKDGSGYRLAKPSGSAGGLLGRLFKKSPEDGPAVTREQRQTRARYDEAVLVPLGAPIVLLDAAVSAPWCDLSRRAVTSPRATLRDTLAALSK